MSKLFRKVGIIVVPIFFLFFFIIFMFGGSMNFSSSGGKPTDLTEQEENAWEIWSLLGEKEYTEEARAGILGNIDQETGGSFIADTDEKGGGGGYGLIQWTPKSVLIEAMKTAGISGDYKSIRTQVDVMDWELSGAGRGYTPTHSYPQTGEEFKQLKDLKVAARAYEKNRERPRDDHPERQELAQKWYDRFHGYNGNSSEGSGNTDITKIALKELGNPGGQKFWSWYGYHSRVEWCATFVSWCGNQAGLDFEKFAYCPTGINNFKAKKKWAEKGTEPKEGYIVFFDWEGDGVSDHVGLVVKCEGGNVYTVEGNSNDAVREQKYTVNSSLICGYGIP